MGKQMSATGGDIMRIYLQNHEKFGTVISAKNLGGPLAKSEKIAEDLEKALHFPGNYQCLVTTLQRIFYTQALFHCFLFQSKKQINCG